MIQQRVLTRWLDVTVSSDWTTQFTRQVNKDHHDRQSLGHRNRGRDASWRSFPGHAASGRALASKLKECPALFRPCTHATQRIVTQGDLRRCKRSKRITETVKSPIGPMPKEVRYSTST